MLSSCYRTRFRPCKPLPTAVGPLITVMARGAIPRFGVTQPGGSTLHIVATNPVQCAVMIESSGCGRETQLRTTSIDREFTCLLHQARCDGED